MTLFEQRRKNWSSDEVWDFPAAEMVVVSIPELKPIRGWGEAYADIWQICSEVVCAWRQGRGQSVWGRKTKHLCNHWCLLMNRIKARRGPGCPLPRFPFFRSPADEKCLSQNKLCLEDLAKDASEVIDSPTIIMWGPMCSFKAFSVCFIKLEALVFGVSMFTIAFSS